jgi:hypothetical protein
LKRECKRAQWPQGPCPPVPVLACRAFVSSSYYLLQMPSLLHLTGWEYHKRLSCCTSTYLAFIHMSCSQVWLCAAMIWTRSMNPHMCMLYMHALDGWMVGRVPHVCMWKHVHDKKFYVHA